MFAPSSNTQYKKGRKNLNKLYNKLSPNIEQLAYSKASFNNLLQFIKEDMEKSIADLEKHRKQYSDSFTDFDADNMFFYVQGKFYTIIKAKKGNENKYTENR